MTSMHNPAHPGLVLRDYLGDLSITTVAERLGVTRAALSRILNGHLRGDVVHHASPL
jgi:plasmid maintenance system antidote protein VapI